MKRLVLISVLAALLSCTPGEPGGRVLLLVDGEPVTAEEFASQLDYEKSYRVIGEPSAERPGWITEDELKSRILNRMLIPLAAVKARYRDRIPVLLEEAEKIRAEVTPANFSDMARKYSKDTNALEGGDWRIVTRYSLYHPVPRLLFTAKKGEIVGPFLSLAGCGLAYVEEKLEGLVPGDDTVRASHILLPYEEGRADFIPVAVAEIVREAKIEVRDESIAKHVKTGAW